jgi:hypothetical protein
MKHKAAFEAEYRRFVHLIETKKPSFNNPLYCLLTVNLKRINNIISSKLKRMNA